MRFGGVVSAALLVSVLGGTSALAEMKINGPAEVPPPGYAGRQYVDSAGCVFVRAGYGKTVNWVPRVSRNKQQLCGYKPTFQSGEAVLDVARVAPETAPAAAAVAAAKPAVATAAAPVAAAVPAPRVAATRPVSPFSPTPFAGRPMATIALTTEPPQIGRAAPASVPASAPVAAATAAAATAAVPMRVAAAAPAPGRSGYVSPYVAGGANAGSVRYHNTVPLPVAQPSAAPAAQTAAAPAAQTAAAPAATIVATETVAPSATSCPVGTASAQRYTLSDGRRVVRCGPQTANPAAFINNAAVPGLVVAAAPGGYVSPYAAGSVAAAAGAAPQSYANPVNAPLYGGTGYAASAYQAPFAGAAVAPMTGGTGYAVSQQPMAAAAMAPQQAYAAASPYQAAPAAVTVRGAGGVPTLAPVIVSTKSSPSGYRAAFEDGRLNPYRGPRSGWGDAQQGEIWTNEVPARAVTAKTPARKRIVPVELAPVARFSTKSMPVDAPVAAARPAATARHYVQVGTFAVPANAESAKARLRAAGLGVASSTTAKGLVVVLAGPFDDARQALGRVRAAGFAEVILR